MFTVLCRELLVSSRFCGNKNITFFFVSSESKWNCFWIRCELFAQWGLLSNEKSARNHNVNTVETRCSKANNLVKTCSSNIGKIIVSKTKND